MTTKALSGYVLLAVLIPLAASPAAADDPKETCPTRDIVIAVDVSQSLSGEEQRGAITNALDLFLDSLGDQHRVGLVKFGTGADLLVDRASLDSAHRATLKEAFRRLAFREQWTDIRAGLDTSYNALASIQTDQPKVVFLLTDGVVSLAGPGGSESAEAADKSRVETQRDLAPQMKRAGVALWAIVYSGLSDPYAFINNVAQETGGIYRREQRGVTKIGDHVLAFASELCPKQEVRKPPLSPPSEPTSGQPLNPERPLPGGKPSPGPTEPGAVPPNSPSGLPVRPEIRLPDAGTNPPGPTAPDAASPDLPLASALLLLGGLNLIAAVLTAFLFRRGARESELHPPALGATQAPIVPNVPFTPKSTGVITTPCHIHEGSNATWECPSCGCDFCDDCNGRYRKPPCCEGCYRRPAPDEDDLSETLIVASAPVVATPRRVVLVAAFRKDRTLIRNAEMRPDGTPFWLMGPSGLLSGKEFVKNVGALRLDQVGDESVVKVIDVPPGGFRNIDTGEAYDSGTRLRNNLRFVAHGDIDERYFEVIFK